MSFFDGITQPTTPKEAPATSFFPSVGTKVTSVPKTPVASDKSFWDSIINPPITTSPIQTKVQTSTPQLSTPYTQPKSWFDQAIPQASTTTPSFFDSFQALRNKNEEIKSGPPISKMSEVFDKYAPPIIKNIAKDIHDGLFGEGQGVDFAGNFVEDRGLIGGLFGSIKSDYARVNDRYEQLVKKGVTPERATKIATQYTRNVFSNPMAFIEKKKVQDETIKNLDLTPDEKSALRTVGFFEGLNTALDSLNFTGAGTIGKNVAEIIAKETYPLAIKKILTTEIRNITPQIADDLSRVLSKVDDPQAVEKIISKVDFSINKYKPKPFEGAAAQTSGKAPTTPESTPESAKSPTVPTEKVTYFHGTSENSPSISSNEFKIRDEKSAPFNSPGISISPNKDVAKIYGKKILELNLEPTAKIITIDEAMKRGGFDAQTKDPTHLNDQEDKAIGWAKSNGYDAIDLRGAKSQFYKSQDEIRVFNKEMLKEVSTPVEKKTQFISTKMRDLTPEEVPALNKVNDIISGKSKTEVIAHTPDFASFDNKERPLILSKEIVAKIKNHGDLVPENLVINANNWDYLIKNVDGNRDKINLIKKIPGTDNFLILGANRDNGFFTVTHYEVQARNSNKLKNLLVKKGDALDNTGRPIVPSFATPSKEVASQLDRISGVSADKGNIQEPDKKSIETKQSFKKPLFSKMSGPKETLPKIKELLEKDIPKGDFKLIFTDELIDGDAVGLYSHGRYAGMKSVLKPMIMLYEEGGKASVTDAFHESAHYIFDNFLSAEEKREALDIAYGKMGITRKAGYRIKGYKGKDVLAEEYIADEYAKQRASEEGYHGPFKRFFEKLDEILKKIVETYRKIIAKIDESLPKKGRQGGFVRTPDLGGEKPKENVPYEIVSTSKEDRLLIEQGIKEMNKIGQRESFLKSLKITLPKELEAKKQALEIQKESLDSNPLRRLIPYMARRGEFKGRLPEVTGKGNSIFSLKGDTIVTEKTGLENSEKARDAFDNFMDEKRKFEENLVSYQREKQAFVKEARAKRDEIITEKKVSNATARTERHIGELLQSEQKKKETIERVAKKEQETQDRLKAEAKELTDYQEMVKKAHINATEKDNLISKFKAIFSPISQTDAVTKEVYLNWEKSKLMAKEEGNAVYEEFKAKPQNDLEAIHEYEAGANTPWIKESFDSLFTEAKRKGLDIYYKENYIPHVYKEKPEVIKKAVIRYMKDQNVAKEVVEEFEKTGEIPEAIAIRLKIRPNFQKIRVFDDYRTAMKYNLTPRFNTVAEHLAYYKEEMGKALANQKLIDDLIKKGKILDAYDAPESWIEVKLPGRLRRSYYAEKNLAEALNGQFRDEDNLSFTQEVLKRLAATSQFMQEIKLSAGIPGSNVNFFSIGQAVKMLTTGVGDLARLNLAGANTSIKASAAFLRANFNSKSIQWLKDNQKYIDMMGKNNINLSRRVDDYTQSYKTWKNILTKQTLKEGIASLKQSLSDNFNKGIFKHPLKQLGTGITDILDSRAMGVGKDVFDKLFNEKTFNSMMPQMQIQVFKDVYEKAVKSGLPEESAAEFAAGIVKNEFGLINDLGRTQVTKDVFNSFFFAPRFREGIVNTFVNAGKSFTTEFNNPLFSRNRALFLGMVLTYIAYNYLNNQLNGNDMWDNEPGREFALKIPLPNGKITYVEFMPSVLSFVRNMGSAGLNFLAGRNDVALQKAGSLFSMPVKLASEVISNQDYFGRPIYEVTDSPQVKAEKAAAYMGLAFTHPYFSELLKYFQDKQDIFQTIVMMTELPLKFSTEDKAAISRHYEELQAKTELNAQQRADISHIVTTYDDVQKLKADGNTGAIEALINAMSDKEYQQYQTIMKYEQIQALKKANKDAQAKQIGDSLTDEEYLQYNAIKTIRTSQKRSQTLQKTIDKSKKPVFTSDTKLDERTLLETVKVYANAIGSDPVTAFNRIFTGQRIRRVDNNTIIVERLPLFESAAIKKERGATAKLKLDHTLPLELGGSNDDSNLKLVPEDVWASYTPIENYIAKLLKAEKVSKQEAQRLILDFKEGKISSEEILKL